jgi:hypothetical protein
VTSKGFGMEEDGSGVSAMFGVHNHDKTGVNPLEKFLDLVDI